MSERTTNKCTYCDSCANICMCAKCQHQINLEQARTGWRPIESAPKDGSKILMSAKGETSIHGIVWDVSTAVWSDIQDDWMLLEIDIDGLAGVTPIEALAWMPLPSLPEGLD